VARAQFSRESDSVRRAALIDATARCLAAHGAGGISVRMVARAAGVSAGLLTHYFSGIDALVADTYRATAARVGGLLDAAVDAAGSNPRARLRAYVGASFTAPVSDPELLATWAAFWSLVAAKPEIAAIHATLAAATRAQIEALIGACGTARPIPPESVRLAAIGLSALIDGLWLERSLDPAIFTAEEAAGLAERWVEALTTL
jgi:TetR/AcrR family transcriptional regulator, transcriptional repressor of bet genes